MSLLVKLIGLIMMVFGGLILRNFPGIGQHQKAGMTLAGIFIGILTGTVLPRAIGMALPVIVITAFWKKIKDRKSATIAVSACLALLIGELCSQLGKVSGE